MRHQWQSRYLTLTMVSKKSENYGWVLLQDYKKKVILELS